MDRTSAAGHLGHLFAPEDIVNNRPPTEITADDLNAHQEELINVILAAGMVPNAANNAQVLAAIQSLIDSRSAAQRIGKNVVVNGGCEVSQINGTAVITPANSQYVIDNVMSVSTAAAKYSLAQVVNGATNSLGNTHALVATALSAYAPAAGDTFRSVFPIEGLNFARFQYGTAFAKVGSLQFKARATTAGTYSGSIQNYAGNRSYPFSFVLAANADTLIKIENIPGDTGGAWVGSANAGSAIIGFSYGAGANYSGAANAWAAANIQAVAGQTNLVATNGATLSVSDVQFEVGSFCTQYERKLYDQVLSECQRYVLPILTGSGGSLYAVAATASSAYILLKNNNLRGAVTELLSSHMGTWTVTNVRNNLTGTSVVAIAIAANWTNMTQLTLTINAGTPTIAANDSLLLGLNTAGYLYLLSRI